jgi:histidinol-phosphate phosphatase family protein
MACQVAILAGGKGTRLRERSGDVPKPLVSIAGKPVLVHQIETCVAAGLTDILLLVHTGHEQIRCALGDGAWLGASLSYRVESEPRGTAGALADALPSLAATFLVLYGDTFFDVDLARLLRAHAQAGADATLFLHPNDHPEDSDLVEIDGSGRVTAMHPYPHAANVSYRNLVNAAMYVFRRHGLERHVDTSRPSDIAQHVFPAMLAAGSHLHGHVSPEYIKDMGTPGRLDKVERDIASGLVERLSARQLRSAVFIDRDGTLNREVDHLTDADQLELLPGAVDAVRGLNAAGRLAVIVTNQPVVARGDVTAQELAAIHRRLEWTLGAGGAYLDAIYVCPHHPDRGFAGEVAALKIRCACRKPGTGLVDEACRDLGIDRQRSWLVGDTTSDILCGQRAGVRTVLVETGYAGRDGKHAVAADYVAADFATAVRWIVQGHDAVARQLAGVVPMAVAGRLTLIGGLARSGKSSAAQVLKEALAACGRTAHVIDLDAWLRPAGERSEGAGVLSRYDVNAAMTAVLSVINASERRAIELPTYDRLLRSPGAPSRRLSIGTGDAVIVEGVPALMIDSLRAHASATVFADCDETERTKRLRALYAWRQTPEEELSRVLESRARDESPLVMASAAHASFTVRMAERT